MPGLYLVSRIGRYLAAFLLIVTLNFFLARFMPGDPLIHLLGEESYNYLYVHEPDTLEGVKAQYGLDKPLPVQYCLYLAGCLRGDFGWSYQYGQPVFAVIAFRLKWTLVLLLPATVISVLLGACLGALSGWEKGRRVDLILTPLFLFFYTLPTYCFGMLLILFFAFSLDLFPLGGMVSGNISGIRRLVNILWHLCLPLIVLVVHNTAYNYLIMRNAVVQVKTEEYVLTALAKGLKERQVLFGHVFKNALPPLVTVVALDFGFLLAGALLVEIVFSWQGMGTLIYESVISRDYPLLQGCFLILAICVMLANFLADVICAFLDPRIKEGESNA
ncbi:MAG: ABC transporter permease [Peptococcaceae bacterium]|nr:ABC transporter permease [Peptococcaceae bacterium]